jgi:hypothetical protein
MRINWPSVRTLEYALRDLAVSPPFKEGDMNVKPLYRLFGLLGLVAPLMTGAAAAQTDINGPTTTTGRVIIGPVTGTLGLEAAVDRFYSDIGKVVKITAGTAQTKYSRAYKLEALDSLQPGAPVVAQYAVKGVQASAYHVDRVGSGLNVNEGIVTRVDRSRNRITIKFSQGATETFRSARHGAQDADGSVHSRVIVYHANDAGQIVAHYFKPVH